MIIDYRPNKDFFKRQEKTEYRIFGIYQQKTIKPSKFRIITKKNVSLQTKLYNPILEYYVGKNATML